MPLTARGLTVIDVAKDTKIEYKLVTVEEADAANGLISTTSPIGRAHARKESWRRSEGDYPRGHEGIRMVDPGDHLR